MREISQLEWIGLNWIINGLCQILIVLHWACLFSLQSALSLLLLWIKFIVNLHKVNWSEFNLCLTKEDILSWVVCKCKPRTTTKPNADSRLCSIIISCIDYHFFNYFYSSETELTSRHSVILWNRFELSSSSSHGNQATGPHPTTTHSYNILGVLFSPCSCLILEKAMETAKL